MDLMFDPLLYLSTASIFRPIKLTIRNKNILYALGLAVFSTTRTNTPSIFVYGHLEKCSRVR
jgi:hypothetical protein